MKRNLVVAAVAVAVAVAGVVTVSSSSSENDMVAQSASVQASPSAVGPTATAADMAVVARLAGRVAHASGQAPWDDLTGLLPNVKYKFDGTAGKAAMDLVVEGAVVDVVPGGGFKNFINPESEDPDRVTGFTKVAFDDPSADYRTVHLIVKVLKPLRGSPAPKSDIRVGLVLTDQDDLETVKRGLTAIKSYVFFLESDNGVYSYEPGLYAIARDGVLLTVVDADGKLSLPGLGHEEADQYLRKAKNISQLRASAERPNQLRDIRR